MAPCSVLLLLVDILWYGTCSLLLLSLVIMVVLVVYCCSRWLIMDGFQKMIEPTVPHTLDRRPRYPSIIVLPPNIPSVRLFLGKRMEVRSSSAKSVCVTKLTRLEVGVHSDHHPEPGRRTLSLSLSVQKKFAYPKSDDAPSTHDTYPFWLTPTVLQTQAVVAHPSPT
jgi:hypothetical protein